MAEEAAKQDGLDPFKFVQNCAIFFKRSVDDLPSGEEVAQLMAKGLKWRWVICGYLRGPQGDTIFAAASTNDLTPAPDWEEKAYRAVVVQLVNGYMRRVVEMQKEQAEKPPEIVAP